MAIRPAAVARRMGSGPPVVAATRGNCSGDDSHVNRSHDHDPSSFRCQLEKETAWGVPRLGTRGCGALGHRPSLQHWSSTRVQDFDYTGGIIEATVHRDLRIL